MSRSSRKKIVAFCCPGRFQHYFLHRLQERHELLAVVFCDASQEGSRRPHAIFKRVVAYLNPARVYRQLVSRLLLAKYEKRAEQRLERHYPEFCSRQSIPAGVQILTVEDINNPRVKILVQQLMPDLICVNGTNLIREPLLSTANKLPYGILNLHTGISPYARGGNCNLHMLLENNPHIVGATVHRIDKGIDSGDILRSLRPTMEADDPYEYLEAKVFIEGFDAFLECIDQLHEGDMHAVRQWEKGKLFLLKTGYHYEPYLRLQANKMIDAGMLSNYLNNKTEFDAEIRLVE